MPLTMDEIVDGARARARALLDVKEAPGTPVRLAVGVEGGLAPLASGGAWTLQTWAAVSDGGRWSCGGGPSLLIPDSIARRVCDGEELGDVIDELAGSSVRGTRGAWGVLTRDLIDRRDAFRLAVLAALAPFYNPAPWR